MHDPTEGGVAGGVHEMADAAALGVKVFEERISVQPETAQICSYFKLDPLQLIGSGALLVASEAEKAERIIKSLKRKQIPAAIIGEFLEKPNERVLVTKNGAADLPRPKSDHLWKALSQP
jgi:hydrogenase maturation factor